MALLDQFGNPTSGTPSAQQPNVNPQVEQSVSRLATASERTLETVKQLHETVKAMPSAVAEVSKKIEGLGFELEDAVKYADNMGDAITKVAKIAASVKRGIINTKNIQEAVVATDKLVEAQQMIVKGARAGTAEYKKAESSQKKLSEWVSKFRTEQRKFNDDELREFNRLWHETVGDAEKFTKNLKAMSVNHLTRQIHGVSKAFAAVGIGKGFAAKMDKYAAGAEAKKRVQEITEARKSGNIAAAKTKQAEAQAWAKKNFPNLDASQPEFRMKVAQRMGMRKANATKYANNNGPEGESMFEHGGGGFMRSAMSQIAGATEGGLGGVAGLVGEFAPVLAVVEVLREMFDKFVKQNQDMEKSLGKAGLFATGTSGFMQARSALTPENPFSKLGFSFDRNLKMAQAMSETGMAPEELVTGVGQNRASRGAGTGEGFGVGGFGQMQRIAMTTGRLAGLTDTESITQTVKLLQQYRETMESSDDFFIKVTKGAAAAGLTTTKYIGVIDDVNQHFNVMNKNLNQTLAIITELGKTGRLGSEDLKSYMDFLMTGGPPKSMADVATNAFTMMNMGPEQLKGIKAGARMDVDRAVKQAQAAGLGPIKLSDMLGGGAQGKIQQLDLLLANNSTMSPDEKQNAMAALKALKQSASRFSRVNAGGGGITQGFGQLFGESPEELAAMNQSKMEYAIKQSGSSMADFMRNPALAGAKFKAMTGILQTLGLSPDKAMEAFEGRGAMATNMLQDFQGMNTQTKMGDYDRTEMRTSAIEFLKEWKRQNKTGALNIGLNNKTIDELSAGTADSDKALSDFFTKHGDTFAAVAAGMKTTGDYVQKGFHFDKKVTEDDKRAAISEAKKVGMQTQTTGDLIAGAFSKWFNEIIGLMEKIYDKLPFADKKNVEGTNKIYQDNASRADSARLGIQKSMDQSLADMKEAEKKGDSAAYNVAQKTYQTQQDTLNKLDTHSEYLSDANKWLEIVAGNTPPTLDEVSREIGSTTGYLDPSGRGIAPEFAKKFAKDTYDALTAAGGMGDAGTGDISLGSQQWAGMSPAQIAAIKNLQAQGSITGGQQNAQGQSVFHITNYNQYAAEFTHQPAAHNMTSTQDSKVGTPQKKQ